MRVSAGFVRKVAVVLVSATAVVAVAGTAFASGHSTGARQSSALTKTQVKGLIASYVDSHRDQIVAPYIASHLKQIRGAKPVPIEFVGSSSTGGATQTVGAVGPWTMKASCASTGVTVDFDGPSTGEVFGTNSFGATDGGAGSSFQTMDGPGRTFSVGTGDQGSQTVELFAANSVYTVTYFENADGSTPVQCDIVGYMIKLT